MPEKRVPALVAALARIPGTAECGEIYGDGPDRDAVLGAIASTGLRGRVVRAPGFVDRAVLDEALATALCLALPSRARGLRPGRDRVSGARRSGRRGRGRRERGDRTVEEGVNGVVAASAGAEELAAAIVRVREAGFPLRESTLEWFRANAQRLSLAHSLEQVLEAYADA